MKGQIRSFREITEGVIEPGYQKRTPTDFELMTIMREAGYVMKCKPLGQYLGDEDDVLPIRPVDMVTEFLEPSNEGIPTTTP